MTAAVVMGVRQLFPDKQFDTRIPFITGNLMIPFNVRPRRLVTILDPALVAPRCILPHVFQPGTFWVILRSEAAFRYVQRLVLPEIPEYKS